MTWAWNRRALWVAWATACMAGWAWVYLDLPARREAGWAVFALSVACVLASRRLGATLGVLAVGLTLAADAWGAERVPDNALRWRRTLTREVRLYWGLSQPVATFAAQIHQESGWRPDARSAYAAGLGQQTPGTERWLAQIYPADLGGGGGSLDPHWSMRALVLYDRKLWDGRKSAAGDRQRWAFALADYNGGAGWVNREVRLARDAGADPTRWFCSVEHFRARGAAAFKENRAYPERILRKLRSLYATWG